MMDSLAPLQRRVLALVFLALAILLLWFGAVQPLAAQFASGTAERQAKLRRLSHDAALVAQDSQVRNALTAIEQSSQWARLYGGEKPDKAVLELETDLRALIKAPNNPTSMAVQAVTVQGRLTRLAVKVTLAMPIDQLADVLSRVQLNSRFLMIDSLTIQAPDYQAADTNPALSIQAEFVGFMLTRPGSRT